MNRKTRRRMFGKNWRMLVLGVSLLNAPLLMAPARAQSDADIAGWKTEFQNAPKTDMAGAKAAYGALLEKLLPGMSAADYDTRARAQDAFEKAARLKPDPDLTRPKPGPAKTAAKSFAARRRKVLMPAMV